MMSLCRLDVPAARRRVVLCMFLGSSPGSQTYTTRAVARLHRLVQYSVEKPAIGIAMRLDNHVSVKHETVVPGLGRLCSHIFTPPARRLRPGGGNVSHLAAVAGVMDDVRYA